MLLALEFGLFVLTCVYIVLVVRLLNVFWDCGFCRFESAIFDLRVDICMYRVCLLAGMVGMNFLMGVLGFTFCMFCLLYCVSCGFLLCLYCG